MSSYDDTFLSSQKCKFYAHTYIVLTVYTHFYFFLRYNHVRAKFAQDSRMDILLIIYFYVMAYILFLNDFDSLPFRALQAQLVKSKYFPIWFGLEN